MSKSRKILVQAFGVNEAGLPDIPRKFSNVKLSRFANMADRGNCPYCYPHGVDTNNATARKHTRNWKHHRRTQPHAQ